MTAARQYSITYQGVAVPGAVGGVSTTLHEVHALSVSSRDFSVSYSVLLHSASTPNALATASATFEDTLREPRGDLLVTLNGTTALDARTTTNAALNVEASVVKGGSDADTGGSRLYEVTISGDLPWKISSPGSGMQGLRDFSYDVEFTASRQAVLNVNGEYTAQEAGSDGRAQYLAQIDARVTTILSLLGGTWPAADKPEAETYTPDNSDAVVSFSRTYREIIFGQQVGALNRPEIMTQTMTVTRDVSGIEDDSTGSALPFETLRVTYEAAVDKAVTTALTNVGETVSRPWCLERARAATGAKTFLLQSESVTSDGPQNILRAELVVKASDTSVGQLLSARFDTSTEVEFGLIVARLWPGANASKGAGPYNPTKAYVTQGPRTTRQTITTTVTFLPPLGNDAGRHANLKLRPAGADGQMGALSSFSPGQTISISGTLTVLLISRNTSTTQRKMGDPRAKVGTLIDVTDRVQTEIVELVGTP